MRIMGDRADRGFSIEFCGVASYAALSADFQESMVAVLRITAGIHKDSLIIGTEGQLGQIIENAADYSESMILAATMAQTALGKHRQMIADQPALSKLYPVVIQNKGFEVKTPEILFIDQAILGEQNVFVFRILSGPHRDSLVPCRQDDLLILGDQPGFSEAFTQSFIRAAGSDFPESPGRLVKGEGINSYRFVRSAPVLQRRQLQELASAPA